MTKSQFKKEQARLFNLRRAEEMAYDMHYKRYPSLRPTRGLTRREAMILLSGSGFLKMTVPLSK